MQKLCALIVLALLWTPVYSDEFGNDNEFNDGPIVPDDGWFFYKNKTPPKPAVEPAPKEAQAKAPETAQSPKEKKPMTVAWMRKMIPILQERAYDNPTQENVTAYAYLVKALGDKAQRYTDVHMELIKTDPFLDRNNNIPTASANRNEVLAKAGEEHRNALAFIAKKTAGIMVFFDSKCSFCKTQISAVNRLAKRFNFEVLYVSVDGKGLPGAKGWVPDNGHAKMLGINFYPTTVLAIPPKTYSTISMGLMADDQLEKGIITAAKVAGIIPEDMAKELNPFDRGVMTLKDMEDGAYDDPAEFVEYVKGKLKDRY